jgi:hypothetical protein
MRQFSYSRENESRDNKHVGASGHYYQNSSYEDYNKVGLNPIHQEDMHLRQGLNKVVGGKGRRLSPIRDVKNHSKTRHKNHHSKSNSKKRIDLRGPYAQNLAKPKLYEARGLQKIALKQ